MRPYRRQTSFADNQRAATAVEYCLIAGIIVLAIVGAPAQLSTRVEAPFNEAADGLEN